MLPFLSFLEDLCCLKMRAWLLQIARPSNEKQIIVIPNADNEIDAYDEENPKRIKDLKLMDSNCCGLTRDERLSVNFAPRCSQKNSTHHRF
jgi:hypothetical protein